MNNIESFIAELHTLDVILWVENERLRYSAPQGALTPDLRTKIVERKSEIIAFLNKIDATANSSASERPSLQPISRDGNILLAYAQESLWFLDQLEGGGAAYNIPFALRLRGTLNHDALEKSFREIIRRHEALRTIFVSLDGQPVQQILPELPFALPIADLSAAPSAQQTDQIKKLATQDAQRPFDLAQGPLLRASLLKLANNDHILLLNIHHIISDGWSIGLLIHELGSLYAAYAAGQAPSLSELPIQYADFSAWQRKWLQGEILEKQLTYWKQQLAHSPALLELPTSRPRPAKQTFHGHSLTFHLDTALAQNLKALSRQKNATLFMTLYAAFSVLLSRYSRQKDLIIGSPIANRSRPELEQLIGFFVNTLALRADLSNNPTFTQLLNQVRQTTLDAYAHQDIPFEKLVEQLHPERSLSHPPIFQVMFALQNAPAEKLEMPGLHISSVAFENNTAKFDLTLEMEETEKNLTGSFEYNTDLFDETTIQRMIGHWQTLLPGIVSNPEQKVAEIRIMTEVERQQILTQWNDTRAEFPQRKCIHQMFEEQAKRAPDSIAVVFENQSLTYRELNKRANQLARFLQKRGVGADVLVGICVERSIEMIVGLLGILKAGGAYVPIDPDYPQERIAFILEDIQSSVFLTQRHVLDRLSTLEERAICLDQAWINIAQEDPENLNVWLSDDNLAYVIYTSGSTGQPKGVQVAHKMLRNLIGWHQQAFSVSTTDQITQIAGAAFDASAWEIWPCLVSGARLHIADEKTRLSPMALRDWLISQRITISFLPTPLAEAILELDWPAEIPLRILLTGGDKLHTHPRPALPFTLVNNYGPTENTVVTTSAIVPPQKETAPTPSIGGPIKNTQVYMLDAHLQLVPAGIAGELYVAGLGLARGYLNRSDLTAEKFLPNPFSAEPGARMYRTGDLARWLPDGRIEFLGRIDHQVKIRGFRIELGEIESALALHPDVQETVVLAREDNPGDKRLVAYVVFRSGSKPEADELRMHLKDKLPQYMLPSVFVFLSSLPLTPNGKVDRKALPPPTTNSQKLEFLAPRNDLERKIAAVWEKVLVVEQIGVDDNFFLSGGDSLKVVQVVHHMGYVCSVMDIFERQTVRELAEHIVAQNKAETAQSARLLYELTPRIPPANRTLSLVCFPPAGGNAIVYKDLADHLPSGYALYALEMPGHDIHKPDEKLLPWSELAALCVDKIKKGISGPIALYGHSAGASLALEVARLLEQENLPLTAVYLGANFPYMRLSGGLFEYLNLERLVSDRVYEDAQRQVVGSLFDEFDPQAKAVRTRSWRHDGLENADYYTFAQKRWQGQKLKARIISVVGEKDRGTEFYAEQVNDWRLFGENVSLRVIPHAGHYFMKHQAAELADILVEQRQTAPISTPELRTEKRSASIAQFMVVGSGQFISAIGTVMSSYALGVWIYKSTGSVTNLAGVAFFEVLPLLLFLPIAGAIADRWDRRKILMLCDGTAALNTVLLAVFLFTGVLQLWHLWVFSTIYAISSAFQQPAYLAGVAQLVPKRYLAQANGFVQLGQAVGNVLAPLLGGFLIETINLQGVVVLDLITYLFSFSCLAITRFPNALFKKEEEAVIKAILGGWKYLLRRRGLLAMALYFAGNNVGNSILSVMLIPFILSFATPNLLGIALGAWGLGMAVGSIVMILWGGLYRRVNGIISSFIFMSAFTVLAGLSTSPLLLCLSLFGNGFCFSLAAGHFYPLLQVKVGDELLGRILSTFRMVSYSSIPLAYLMAGPLADHVFGPLAQSGGIAAQLLGTALGSGPGRGMGLMLMAVGSLVIVWGLLAFLYRPLREMETDIPDAQMDAVIYDDKDVLQQEADKLLSSG